MYESELSIWDHIVRLFENKFSRKNAASQPLSVKDMFGKEPYSTISNGASSKK